MADTYVPGFTPSLSNTASSQDIEALMAQMQRMNEMYDQWMAQPFSPVLNTRYDPNAYGAAGQYLSGLDEYAKSLGVTGYNPMNLYPGLEKILPSQHAQLNILPEYSIIKEQSPAIPGMAIPPTLYSAEEYAQRLKPALEANTPYEQMVEYRLGVPINYGLTGKDINPYQTFGVRYNTPVALIDQASGKVLYSGTGFEAAKQAADQAYNMSRDRKTYTLATADPATGQWTPVVTDAPNKSAFVDFAKLALPAIGAAAFAPIGALAAAGGAAGGSALGGVLGGDSLADIAKNAAIAGATTYGGSQLLKATGLDKAIGSLAGNGATAALDPATQAAIAAGLEAGPITVVGSSLAPIFTGAAAGLGSNALQGALDKIAQQTTPNVPMPGEAPGSVVTGAPGATAGTNAGGIAGAVAGSTIPTQPGVSYDPVTNEITVANKKPDIAIPPSIINTPSPTPPDLSQNLDKVVEDTKPNLDKNSTLDDIIKYLRAGGLGIGLLGDLFGGNKGVSPGLMPGGPSKFNPIFSAKLPAANLPTATPRPASALPQTTQDWYRYGYGPEQSFFSNVPQGAPNTSTAFTGYAEGGSTGTGYESQSSFAVGGPGDGRDDKIRAALSDGEYVFDAETVAMLGNGSSKAGADALDRFRVNIRKHKGRNLAKGKFSADAKKPEQYLKGRK